MDLINGGRYEDSARIFVEKILPLKAIVTAYADTGKLSEEIAKIETSVGSRTRYTNLFPCFLLQPASHACM